MSQFLGHDPLCTWRQAEEADAGDPRRWLAGGLAVCDCDLIAKVREDERRQSASDYVDGERDMLAKCIAAVRAVEGGYSMPLGMSVGAFIDVMRHQFIAALCDLEETL